MFSPSKDFAAAIAMPLSAGGHRYFCTGTADELCGLVERDTIDLIMLHWELGAYEVLELCARLRSRAWSVSLPIMILSEWAREAAVVKAYDVGADDYVRLPVSDRELALRTSRLLTRPARRSFGAFLIHDDIVLNLGTHQVVRARRLVALRPAEFKILRALMSRPGEILSIDDLTAAMRRASRSLTVKAVPPCIASLRKALASVAGGNPVRTVAGVGYTMD